MPELSRDDLEALYREVVLDHYRRPRHRDALDHCDGEALVANPVCGDQVRVQVAVAEDGTIARVSARARGCSIAVAAGSVMTELVLGRTRADAQRFASQIEALVAGEDPSDVERSLIPFARVADLPSRHRCATLAWEALDEALEEAAG